MEDLTRKPIALVLSKILKLVVQIKYAKNIGGSELEY